jgi:pimeloyl-ACP methyl ester carboxylesterase
MTSADYQSLDEFGLLPADAAEFGLPWRRTPAVSRVTVLGGDRPVSSLRWGAAAPGRGRPDLVLLHGAALNAHTWDVFALAARRPLLALDLPGHGESAWRDDGRYGPQDIAPAVADVIGQLAAAPATVVGQSLGGLTAIALAAARPDLVAGLVLVDVLPAVGNADQVRSFLAGPEVFSSRAEIVTRARVFGFGRSDAAVARGVWHNTRVRPDGSVVWKHHLGNLGGLGSGGPDQPIPSDFSALWPALEAFAGPVLLVRGTRGFLPADAAAELRSRVPGAQVREVATGHNVQEDDPVLLAEIVGRFLADTGARAEGAPR